MFGVYIYICLKYWWTFTILCRKLYLWTAVNFKLKTRTKSSFDTHTLTQIVVFVTLHKFKLRDVVTYPKIDIALYNF